MRRGLLGGVLPDRLAAMYPLGRHWLFGHAFPLTLPWAGLWRADYAGEPWVGDASDGVSGGRLLTEATNPPGYVIFLNTATEKVELVRAAGVNPTDFDISYQESKLFVSNHGVTSGSVRVIDLTTREQVRTMNAGTDVYKLNAGRNGRLVAEGLDQWVNASLLNSVSGATITTVTFREGDGEFDPTGRYYYHCDNNNSDADISRHASILLIGNDRTDRWATSPAQLREGLIFEPMRRILGTTPRERFGIQTA